MEQDVSKRLNNCDEVIINSIIIQWSVTTGV